jgi:hypothetical protein
MVNFKYILGREVARMQDFCAYDYEYYTTDGWNYSIKDCRIFDDFEEADKTRRQLQKFDSNGRKIKVVKIHPDNLTMFDS